MGRACLGPSLIGRKAHEQCKCKERAGVFFKTVDPDMEKSAKNVCNGDDPEQYQTAKDFADGMNLTESEILSRYGYDINKENGLQTADTQPKNTKFLYFGALVLVLILLAFLIPKS
jgi:hypothetical protein